MKHFISYRRSLIFAALITACTITVHAKSTASDDADSTADAITKLDKMVVSEKPDGVIPLMWCSVGKLTGRITIAPTVPPPTRAGERFKITAQYRPNTLKFRGPLFDTVTFEGTPSDYGFTNGSRWKNAATTAFPPELCLPNGGQVVAIDGHDIWDTSIFQLRDLWFNGRAGDPVTVVIQGVDEDRFIFREITLKRISLRKWQQLLRAETPPPESATTLSDAPPAP